MWEGGRSGSGRDVGGGGEVWKWERGGGVTVVWRCTCMYVRNTDVIELSSCSSTKSGSCTLWQR